MLESRRKRRACIGGELIGDTGAQPVFVVGAILVLEVAVAVAGAAGESRHRGKRPPPSQAGPVEFFVTPGAPFVGSTGDEEFYQARGGSEETTYELPPLIRTSTAVVSSEQKTDDPIS